MISEFPPDVDFGEMQICAAQYGGPVALIKSPQQIIRSPGTRVNIFTATGKRISTFEWNSGSLLKLGWSDTEELICVQEDGIVLRYNMFGEFQHKFSLGQEVKDTRVIDARIFASSVGTGVAVMTTKFRISLVNSVTEPKTRLLAEMPSSSESLRVFWSSFMKRLLLFPRCPSDVLGNRHGEPQHICDCCPG